MKPRMPSPAPVVRRLADEHVGAGYLGMSRSKFRALVAARIIPRVAIPDGNGGTLRRLLVDPKRLGRPDCLLENPVTTTTAAAFQIDEENRMSEMTKVTPAATTVSAPNVDAGNGMSLDELKRRIDEEHRIVCDGVRHTVEHARAAGIFVLATRGGRVNIGE